MTGETALERRPIDTCMRVIDIVLFSCSLLYVQLLMHVLLHAAPFSLPSYILFLLLAFPKMRVARERGERRNDWHTKFFFPF